MRVGGGGGGGRVAVAWRAGPLRVWRCLDDFDQLEPPCFP